MNSETGKMVVCVGGANIDIQGFSAAPINMRDSNPGTIRLCPGGVGRNIAENMARLGLNVSMISAVGDDSFGDVILKSCSAAGMDISDIEIIPGVSSSAYVVLTDSDGDMLAAVSDMHIMKGFGRDFILRHAHTLDAASAIILDPNLSGESLETLVSGWHHKPLFADPISTTYARSMKRFLPDLFMIKCNRQEAEIFADMVIQNEDDLDTAMDRILSSGINCAVITLGENGVLYKDQGGLKLRKVHPPLHPVSATGAGDSFTAAMVYGMVNGWEPDKSLELAMKAAELTIMDSLTVSPAIGSLTASFLE